jgi:LPS export ABC transporter protein LptC
MGYDRRELSKINGLINLLFAILILLNSAIIYAQESDQQFLGFELAGYSDRGQKTWEVKGKSADVFSDMVRLKDVDAKLYGDEEVTLTSKKGDFDKANNRFHLEEDVVITTQTGSRVTTDSLDWVQKTNLISTDDKITINRENMTATSKGAEAQPDLNKAKLFKDVSVQINTEDEDNTLRKTVITCDGPLEIDYNAQLAVFYRNVKVEDESGEIYSNKMEVYFDFETKKITKIVASGDVKIVRGENISYSDKAVYTAVDKKVILTGRPKLILYSKEGFKDVSIGN